MAIKDQTASGSATGLRRDAIGLREVLFQSITDMAPGAAIAASIPAGALYAGGALPLSVLIALVACLLTASCIGQLARELPSAGSVATYTARGLHPSVGFLTAWGYVLIGVLIAPLVLLQLGFTTFAGFGSSGAASWEGMARSLYGLFWFFVFLAIVNSTVANANAGFNVASRTGFAMGRIGAFPHMLARVHPRFRSPVVAILLTFLITVAVMLGLGLAYNPTNAFAMVGTGIVIVLVAVYIVVNAACIGYFASPAKRGPDRRWNPAAGAPARGGVAVAA